MARPGSLPGIEPHELPAVVSTPAMVRVTCIDFAPDEVRAILRLSADDVGSPGHDRASGAGIADAARALETPKPGVMAEISSPRQGGVWSQQAREIILEGTAAGPEFGSFGLSVGEGVEPASWQPLAPASAAPVEGGVLGAWPIALLQLAVFVASIAVLIRTAPPFITEMTRSSSLGHNRRWWAAALVAAALCGTLGYVVRKQDWMAFGGSASMLGTAPVAPPSVPSTCNVNRSSRRTRTAHDELNWHSTPFSSSNVA